MGNWSNFCVYTWVFFYFSVFLSEENDSPFFQLLYFPWPSWCHVQQLRPNNGVGVWKSLEGGRSPRSLKMKLGHGSPGGLSCQERHLLKYLSLPIMLPAKMFFSIAYFLTFANAVPLNRILKTLWHRWWKNFNR